MTETSASAISRDSALAVRTPVFLTILLVAVIVQQFLVTGTRSMCFGGVTADGGFLDRNGNPTEVVPSCVSLAVGPNSTGAILVAVAAIVTLYIALQRARDGAEVKRVLGIGLAVIIGTMVVMSAIAMITLFAFPLPNWEPGQSMFLFGVTLDVSPMTR